MRLYHYSLLLGNNIINQEFAIQTTFWKHWLIADVSL